MAPGEEKQILFTLGKRSFAYYEERIHDWYVESGDFTVLIGTSSEDLPLSAVVSVKGTAKIPFIIADTTTCGDVWNYAENPVIMDNLTKKINITGSDDNETLGISTNEFSRAMMDGMPLHSLPNFCKITGKDIDDVVAQLKSKK